MTPPTQITLTPTNNISRYRISWAHSIFDIFSYTITTSPPTAISESGDVIVQNPDEVKLNHINVAISSCPGDIYSTFRIGMY